MLHLLRRFWFYEHLKRNKLARATLLPIYYFVRHRALPVPKMLLRCFLALTSRGPTDPSLVVMIVISDVWIDPRVEREARALAEAGYTIKILAPDYRDGTAPTWGPNISFRLFHNRVCHALIGYPYVFSLELTTLAAEQRPFAYHCHDLNTFLAGFFAAKFSGAKLVIDMHEWFSENVSDAGGQLVPHTGKLKRMYQRVERLALRSSDLAITVCHSIADELKKVHPRRIEVIRNIPTFAPGGPYPPIKKQLGLSESSFVLLYQGGVGPTRDIEPMIAALAHLPEDVVLVIRGPGMDYYKVHYDQLAAKFGVSHRVHCLVPVPSAYVVSAARGADAGLWSLQPICKNFEYALPNKVFEYLAAGLPVLAADLPEIRRTILDPGLGYGFLHSLPRSIADAVLKLRQDKLIKARVAAAQFSPDWPHLAQLYQSMITQAETTQAQPIAATR